MISSTFDKNKVFTVMWSEIEGRIDCGFYKPEYNSVVKKIKSKNHIKLGNLVEFVNSSWDQKSIYKDKFPYIEIGTVNLIDGSISSMKQVEVKNAPSRAKKVVYSGDVIVSATRPSRGAVVLINEDQDKSICSTGFIVLRDIKNTLYNKKALQLLLRTSFVLKQCEQRQSGGNYPAITESEYKKILVPAINDVNKIELISSVWDKAISDRIEKLKQAEDLLKSIDAYLLSELNLQLPELKNGLANRKYIVNSKEIIGNRFDPSYHSKQYELFLQECNKKNIELLKLKDICSNIYQGVGRCLTDDKSNILLKVKNILPENQIDYSDIEYVDNPPKNKQLQVGDIISPFIGEAIRQFKFSVFNNNGNYFVDNNTGVIRLKQKYNVLYVCAILNSKIMRFQIERLIGGGVPFIGTTGAKELLIPIVDNKIQNNIALHIAKIYDNIGTLKIEAQQCIESARAQIEQIILGE